MLHTKSFPRSLWLREPVRVCPLLVDWVLVRESRLVNHLLNLFLLAELGALPKVKSVSREQALIRKVWGSWGVVKPHWEVHWGAVH